MAVILDIISMFQAVELLPLRIKMCLNQIAGLDRLLLLSVLNQELLDAGYRRLLELGLFM